MCWIQLRSSIATCCLILAPGPVLAQGAPQAGDILVVDSQPGELLDVDPDTGDQEIISSGALFDMPNGLDLDETGAAFVSDGIGDQVVRIDTATGAQSLVATDASWGFVRDLAFEPTGMLVVVDELAAGSDEGAVYRVNPSTLATSTVAMSRSLAGARGVGVADDGTIYVAITLSGLGFTDHVVVSVDPDDGTVSEITRDGLLEFPNDLVVAPAGHADEGDLFVADGDGIVRVEPGSGTQTQVTVGGFFDRSAAIDWDLDGNLVVTQIFGDSVVRVDPATGDQELVSSGGTFGLLQGIAVVEVPEPDPQSTALAAVAAFVLLGIRRTPRSVGSPDPRSSARSRGPQLA